MSTGAIDESGPVLFAYDGSELAGHAITEAGRELRAGRDAVVLTVWEPFNVGFLPVGGTEFDAAGADEVRAAAEKTAQRATERRAAPSVRRKAHAASCGTRASDVSARSMMNNQSQAGRA